MKKYKLIYLTKQNDILLEEMGVYFNISDARRAASAKMATSTINDLHKIAVRRVYE